MLFLLNSNVLFPLLFPGKIFRWSPISYCYSFLSHCYFHCLHSFPFPSLYQSSQIYLYSQSSQHSLALLFSFSLQPSIFLANRSSPVLSACPILCNLLFFSFSLTYPFTLTSSRSSSTLCLCILLTPVILLTQLFLQTYTLSCCLFNISMITRTRTLFLTRIRTDNNKEYNKYK